MTQAAHHSRSTPVEADPSGSAVRRLPVLAVLLATVVAVFGMRTTLDKLGLINYPGSEMTAFDVGVVIAAIAGCSAMIAVARLRRFPAERVLDWGLAFQVFGGLCLSLLEQAVEHRGIFVSFACIWILSFTVMPVSISRAKLAAWATALMGPFALMIQVVIGRRLPPAHGLEWLTFVPTLLSAAMSTVISRIIYGLGKQVEHERQLGAYALVEQLGKGGMGEVWRAEHHALIRPAAIKLLRRDLTSALTPEEREVINLRFQREVQATALLTSPHTVAVFDFGYSQDGSMYYVMELLTGLDAESLVMRHGPQPAERVIHLLMQACDSLSEAHSRNLVHRDIKPANLYLCAQGLEVDFLKVLDFGLVRDEASDLRLTNEGAVSGTPAYLAPEASTQRAFDARSDIYGLGCVAYYLLTGQLVFHGPTAAAVIASHIRDRPVPPSKRTELAIPRELEDIVMACLAKDPDARPQTADELRRLLEGVPVDARWTRDRAHAWWQVHLPELVQRATEACGPDSRSSTPVRRRRPEPHVRGTP